MTSPRMPRQLVSNAFLLKPFDIAYGPEPQPTPTTAAIPYAKIELNTNVISTYELTSLNVSANNVIEEVVAVAKRHLQKSERKKLMSVKKYKEGTDRLNP